MTIKLGNKTSFEVKKEAYMELLRSEESTQEEREDAFNEMFEALQTDLSAQISKEARDEIHDAQILSARGQNVLTAKEKKFFNEIIASGGFTEDSILPETTQERVFDDLIKEYPLLKAIGLQDLGAVTRFIYSDPKKTYAWGNLFGEIKGQVSTAFREEKISQMKLTAFAVIPKDMEDIGPEWIERYVRRLLVETYAVGMEYGLLKGKGPSQDEPIGLMKNVDSETGAVTDKVPEPNPLTFAPSQFGEVVAGELHGVIKKLSVNEKGKARKVLNKVVMVVNPIDLISVQARNTIQTSNGQWVTALPYNIELVESEEMDEEHALFFVKGEYIAAIAGGYKINKYDQTLAIEDANLYTMKQFANGKPKDNKAALLYKLEVSFDQIEGA